MSIFVNKEVKRLFTAVVAALLIFMVLGQLVVRLIADDYKQNMITHDYGVAGYLADGEGEKPAVISAFTSEKTGNHVQIGQKLLEDAGYSRNIQNNLLPEVEGFHQKYAMIMLIISIAFSIVILTILLLFTLRQGRRAEKANADIQAFMAGDVDIRLDDHEEGSLSRLFTSINEMATSLTSHITKEKQNKEFLKATISDISHQLKTPLAALKMYNEIIQDEKNVNDVVESFALKTERELNRMETLIQNLLRLAKIDAGSIELRKSTRNVKAFLAEVINGFRTRADLEKKAILLHCDERITFSFDEEWLLEAVGNIVKNALDHTDANDQIEIRCDETPLLVTIAIKDDGMGIHPEDVHHIFKRFYRSRFSKDQQGVGIGLTLSKAIVEKHGGTVTVESKWGEGTVFRLVFPKLSNL